MTVGSSSYLHVKGIGLLAISLCGFLLCRTLAVGGESSGSSHSGKTPIRIELQDAQGLRIAGPATADASSKATSAVLVFDREYKPGDRILFAGAQRMAVRVDESLPECLLYLPAESQ